MKAKKIYMRDIWLYDNSGVCHPMCRAHMRMLDLAECNWPMMTDKTKVTCKNCMAV